MASPDLCSGSNRIYIPVTMRRHKDEEAGLRKRVGAEIRRRMAAAGKKPADIAGAADIDDSQVSKVLSGRAGLSLYSLGRIAAALGCTSAEILAASENKRAPKGSKKRGSDVLKHAASIAPPAARE